MHIDWLTVVAQIFNFLLLVWLLKRYLYQPVISAMDRREQRITDELTAASQREQAAANSIASYEQKIVELDKSRNELLIAAKDAAETERTELIWKASREAVEKRTSWKHEIDREQQEFLDNLTRVASHSLVDMLSQSLTNLAGQQLETQIIQTFIEKIKHSDNLSREIIGKPSDEDVRISTTYELPPETRELLTKTLDESLDLKTRVQFSESPELICGIELILSNQRIAWSIADYMQTLEQLLRKELDANAVSIR